MKACSIWEMLEEHRSGAALQNPVRPAFKGVEGYDVYNPTAPFSYNGKTMLCARVEKRDSEDSQAVFFEETAKDIYEPAEGWARFPLQDPSMAKVQGYYILGGTRVYPHPDNPERVCWRTAFYYGKELDALQFLAEGPEGMKDIRLVDLADGGIGIFTRPQGEKGGRGKIGFTRVESLAEVTAKAMEDAPLLDLFSEEEWGGVNEARLLADGKVGVLGHIACFEPEEIRHYYPMAFVFDPVVREYTRPVILAERKEFLPGPGKRPDLKDVLFSGGLKEEGGKTFLYAGVSDCEVQYIPIRNPFGSA